MFLQHCRWTPISVLAHHFIKIDILWAKIWAYCGHGQWRSGFSIKAVGIIEVDLACYNEQDHSLLSSDYHWSYLGRRRPSVNHAWGIELKLEHLSGYEQDSNSKNIDIHLNIGDDSLLSSAVALSLFLLLICSYTGWNITILFNYIIITVNVGPNLSFRVFLVNGFELLRKELEETVTVKNEMIFFVDKMRLLINSSLNTSHSFDRHGRAKAVLSRLWHLFVCNYSSSHHMLSSLSSVLFLFFLPARVSSYRPWRLWTVSSAQLSERSREWISPTCLVK